MFQDNRRDYRFRQVTIFSLLLLSVLVGLLLRLYRIEMNALSLDEIGQVLVAQNSLWKTIISSAQHYGNTPLDYVITHLMLFIGKSEFVVRFPSLIWGTASIFIIYKLAKNIFNKVTGLVAAWLFALTPLYIFYARIARPYSLSVFLNLSSVLLFLYAIRSNKWQQWVLWSGVSVLALYSHYYTLIIIFCFGIWLLVNVKTKCVKPEVFRKFIITGGIIVVMFVPWVYWDWHYELTFKSGLLDTPFSFNMPPIPTLLSSFFFTGDDTKLIQFTWLRSKDWVVLSAILLAIVSLMQHKKERYLLAIIIIVGIGSALFLDYKASYFFNPRQMLIFSPFLVLLTSNGLVEFGRQISRVIGKILALVSLATIPLSINLTYLIGEGIVVVVIFLMGILYVYGIWIPLINVYSIPSGNHWRETARYLMRVTNPQSKIFAQYSSYLLFYAPELGDNFENIENVLSRDDGSVDSWLLIVSESRLQPKIKQWIVEHQSDLVDVSLDKHLRLYHISSIENNNFSVWVEDINGMVNPLPFVYSSDLVIKLIAQSQMDTKQLMWDMVMDEELLPYERMLLAKRVGYELSNKGEQNKAIEILRYGLFVYPYNSDGWFILGRSFARAGKIKEAETAYRRAISIDPFHSWANIFLAAIITKQPPVNSEYVLKLYKHALVGAYSDDLKSDVWENIAHTYLILDASDKACYAFNKSIQYASETEEKQRLAQDGIQVGCEP